MYERPFFLRSGQLRFRSMAERFENSGEAPGLPDPETLSVREYQVADERAVLTLWGQCGLTRPWNDPRKDITRKLGIQPSLFLVAVLDGRVVGSVMAGYEGHRGWINYLAVAPECRRSGFGRRLMEEAERRLLDLGCPKINLQVRSSNRAVIEFYQRIGYVVDDVVSLGKRIISDEDAKE